MKRRLTVILVIIVFGVIGFFGYSNRASLSSPSGSTADCGCNVACMGGKSCAINCPTGKAAHCDCVGNAGFVPQEAKCYCQ